jgi:hypothetical protein
MVHADASSQWEALMSIAMTFIQSAAETVRHYWRPPRFKLKA